MEHYLVFFVDSKGFFYNKGIFSHYFEAHEFIENFDLNSFGKNSANIRWAVIEKWNNELNTEASWKFTKNNTNKFEFNSSFVRSY